MNIKTLHHCILPSGERCDNFVVRESKNPNVIMEVFFPRTDKLAYFLKKDNNFEAEEDYYILTDMFGNDYKFSV